MFSMLMYHGLDHLIAVFTTNEDPSVSKSEFSAVADNVLNSFYSF